MADQSSASTGDGAERVGVEPTEAWHVSIARFLGRASGWATTEAQAVARRTADAARDVLETSADDAKRVNELVRELVEMVTARADERYESLERDPDFWRLVSELHHARGGAARNRITRYDRADEDVGARHGDVIDVLPTDPRTSEDAATPDDEDDAAPPEGQDGVVAASDDGSEDSVQDEPRARERKASKGASE